MPPKVTGTATYEKVEIYPIPDEDRIEVYGHYDGSVTGYSGRDVFIDTLRIEPEGEGHTALTADDEDDKWIWVHAKETELVIYKEKPLTE